MNSMDRAFARALALMGRKPKLSFDPNGPKVSVIRIERRENKHRGAWWSTEMFSYPTDALVWPAWVLAQRTGLPDPNEMPNIMNDSPLLAKNWTEAHYAGFRDLAQADEWFPHPKMRSAVYDVLETCVREYEVPKELVLFGKHQVGFILDEAREVRQLTREEWVRA